MWKLIFSGTTALTLIGTSAVLAQQTTPVPRDNSFAQRGPHFTAEEYVTRANSRIAVLKAELKLTPAQEKDWTTFEAALRESAKERAAHFEQARKMRQAGGGRFSRDERPAPTADEIAAQKRLAGALEPLYKSLNDGQKRSFAEMFRVDGEGRRFWFRGRGDRRS